MHVWDTGVSQMVAGRPSTYAGYGGVSDGCMGYGGVSDCCRQTQCICGILGCPRWLQKDPEHIWDMGMSQMVAGRPSAYFPHSNAGSTKEANKISNKHM